LKSLGLFSFLLFEAKKLNEKLKLWQGGSTPIRGKRATSCYSNIRTLRGAQQNDIPGAKAGND